MELYRADETDLQKLDKIVTDTVPWVKIGGIKCDFLNPCHIKLSVPVKQHMNHLGIVYAGTHFMLMEVAGAALFWSCYGVEKLAPINKGMSIKYMRPATSDISCELTMSREEADERIATLGEKGKCDWVLDMEVKDADGNVVSKATCNYMAMPKPG